MKTDMGNHRRAGDYYDEFLSFDLLDIVQIAEVVHGEKPKICIRENFFDIWHQSKAHTQMKTAALAGSGKTYFAVALLRGLFERNEFGIFVKSGDLDLELLQAAREGDELSALRKYSEVDVLLIDDLGVERDSDRMARQCYQIIDRRIGNNLPTVINSNLRKHAASSDPRIISRLELAYELKFPEKDLRKATKIQSDDLFSNV